MQKLQDKVEVKAMQEQQAQIDDLKTRIEALEG
jgi:hypothetical protein